MNSNKSSVRCGGYNLRSQAGPSRQKDDSLGKARALHERREVSSLKSKKPYSRPENHGEVKGRGQKSAYDRNIERLEGVVAGLKKKLDETQESLGNDIQYLENEAKKLRAKAKKEKQSRENLEEKCESFARLNEKMTLSYNEGCKDMMKFSESAILFNRALEKKANYEASSCFRFWQGVYGIAGWELRDHKHDELERDLNSACCNLREIELKILDSTREHARIAREMCRTYEAPSSRM